jgi:micrococcal nuclease
MIVSSISLIDLRRCESGTRFPRMNQKKQVKIRLWGIDAPETGQDFGSRAKQTASNMAFGRTVKILPRDTDRHGRTVDEVILPDGRSLNQELVCEGMAWWYRHYAPHDAELARLEAEAKSAKRGLWSQPHPVPPREWRKGTLVADLVDLLGLTPTDIEAVGSLEDQPGTSPTLR